MVKALKFTILFLLVSFACNAQQRNCSGWVYLYSGKQIKGNEVAYKHSLLAKDYFIIDSSRVLAREVKLFTLGNESYINKKDILLMKRPQFIKMTIGGRLNLFEQDKKWPVLFFDKNTSLFIPGSIFLKKVKMYYNKGFGDIQEINLKKLSNEMSDNHQALIFLQKYQGLRFAQSSLVLAGGLIYIFEFIFLSNGIRVYGDNYRMHLVAFATGTICFGVSSGLKKPKQMILRKAFLSYDN